MGEPSRARKLRKTEGLRRPGEPEREGLVVQIGLQGHTLEHFLGIEQDGDGSVVDQLHLHLRLKDTRLHRHTERR